MTNRELLKEIRDENKSMNRNIQRLIRHARDNYRTVEVVL